VAKAVAGIAHGGAGGDASRHEVTLRTAR
jgi:hypothetical protein